MVELVYRQTSRAQRAAVHLERAAQMYAVLEDWYDQYPEASFAEIDTGARRLWHELVDEGLAVLISGRDTGHQLEAPWCSVCGHAIEFKGHRRRGISGLEGCLGRMYWASVVAYRLMSTSGVEAMVPVGGKILASGVRSHQPERSGQPRSFPPRPVPGGCS